MDNPTPPRPAPLDTRALVPMLRAQAAEAAVEALAVVAGNNAVTAAEWLRDNWGAEANFADPTHPSRAAWLEEGSPGWKLGEAIDALASACRRYCSSTGGDGLALARPIVDRFGPGVADHVFRALEAGELAWAQVLSLRSPTPAPMLSGAELEAAIGELLSPRPEPHPRDRPRSS